MTGSRSPPNSTPGAGGAGRALWRPHRLQPSPAEGVWEEGGERSHDDIVIFEVMSNYLDRAWWRRFRERLESEFRQEEIVVRAREVEKL
jgi:hypothetical protein